MGGRVLQGWAPEGPGREGRGRELYACSRLWDGGPKRYARDGRVVRPRGIYRPVGAFIRKGGGRRGSACGGVRIRVRSCCPRFGPRWAGKGCKRVPAPGWVLGRSEVWSAGDSRCMKVDGQDGSRASARRSRWSGRAGVGRGLGLGGFGWGCPRAEAGMERHVEWIGRAWVVEVGGGARERRLARPMSSSCPRS